jgi:hypothetical protein
LTGKKLSITVRRARLGVQGVTGSKTTMREDAGGILLRRRSFVRAKTGRLR